MQPQCLGECWVAVYPARIFIENHRLQDGNELLRRKPSGSATAVLELELLSESAGFPARAVSRFEFVNPPCEFFFEFLARMPPAAPYWERYPDTRNPVNRFPLGGRA